MDDCIGAQWGLYIGYIRETLDYTITIMPLTIIPLGLNSLLSGFADCMSVISIYSMFLHAFVFVGSNNMLRRRNF
jgi:hypothetical protein